MIRLVVAYALAVLAVTAPGFVLVALVFGQTWRERREDA